MFEKETQLALRRITKGSIVWIVIPPTSTIDHLAAALVFRSFCLTQGATAFVINPTFQDPRVQKLLPEFAHLDQPPTTFGVQVVIEPEGQLLSPPTVEHRNGNLVLTIPGSRSAVLREITPWQTSPNNVFVFGIPRRSILESAYPTFSVPIQHAPVTVVSTILETEIWGDSTIVEPKASGVSEILARALLTHDAQKQISQRDWTMLYLGVVESTHGFSVRSQFPQTYETVAQLIERGANHIGVIESLYFAKELKELKVWGRALARLERDAHRNIAWTHITQADMERTATTPNEARTVLDELISQTPGNDIAILAIEHAPERVEINIKSTHFGFPLTELFWKYSPLGDNSRIVFVLEQSLLAAEREVIEVLTMFADTLRGRQQT